ncbi:MAG TPA: hypothetical protein VGJ60_06895 [Chloroflexota bacterium]
MTAFEMGDVVLEQAPLGRDGAHNDTAGVLERLAADSGVDYKVLEQRRFVSSRIPPTTRVVGVIWSVYREIAQVADERERSRLLEMVATKPPTQFVGGVERPTVQKRWTIDAIRTHIGVEPYNPPTGSQALLDRAFKGVPSQVILHQAFSKATPEAIDEVLDQPEIRRAVYQGLHRREQQVTARAERIADADPIDRTIDQQRALLDVRTWVDQMRRHVEKLRDDILPRLGSAPTRDPLALRQFLKEALDDLDDATGPIRVFVDTGSSDIDQFLSSVLGGKRG